MQGETIFRFYNLRPAAPVNSTTVQPYVLAGKKTNLLTEFESARANINQLKASCEQVLKKNLQPSSIIVNGSTSAGSLFDWFNQNRFKTASEALKSEAFLKQTGETNAGKIPEAVTAFCANAGDILLALVYTGKSDTQLKTILAVAVKLIHIRYNNHSYNETETLGRVVGNLIISLPNVTIKNPAPATIRKLSTGARPVKEIQVPDFILPLDQLEKLHCTISGAVQQAEFVNAIKAGTATGSNVKKTTGVLANTITYVPNDVINALPASLKNVLSKLKLNLKTVPAIEAMETIEQEIEKQMEAGQGMMSETLIRLEGNLVHKNQFTRSLLSEDGTVTIGALNNGNITASVGDLLLLKQSLKGYALGEIAHVENVLSGEKRERNHRRLNRTTEDYFTEQEAEKTRERDLQSTERNELQNEITKTAATELGIDLSVQVSGSYGPTLSFESQLDSSFSSTVEESQHRASNFSKEISEKSSEKIRERVKTERRKTSVEEIEEVNVHGFENKSEENITGVYRWMDKVYEAQVINYGQRMMLDFILPEPAAFYLFSMLENEEIQIEKPLQPMYGKLPLAPSNISRCNYMKYIRAYAVVGAPEPPPQNITVSFFEKQEGNSKADFARSGKIQIPDHYTASAAAVGSYIVHHKDNTNKKGKAEILIGDKSINVAANNGWDYVTFSRKREKELALALHYNEIDNFSAAIDVFCELTPTGLAVWQNKVYEAIMEGYQRKLDEYEEKIAEITSLRARSSYNSTSYGNNPSYNKTCCNNELRKLAIMLLSQNEHPNVNSYKEGTPPEMDIALTNANGAIIRFFESAFEWNNMAYVLYPYFWGRKARWLQAIQMHENENEFTTFLKAGAARVQLPVRPGFENAVAFYMQYGHLWESSDGVVGEDNAYYPIVNEIMENAGILNQGVPYPANSTPWEVRIPTSLVFLQREVPEMEDSLELS